MDFPLSLFRFKVKNTRPYFVMSTINVYAKPQSCGFDWLDGNPMVYSWLCHRSVFRTKSNCIPFRHAKKQISNSSEKHDWMLQINALKATNKLPNIKFVNVRRFFIIFNVTSNRFVWFEKKNWKITASVFYQYFEVNWFDIYISRKIIIWFVVYLKRKKRVKSSSLCIGCAYIWKDERKKMKGNSYLRVASLVSRENFAISGTLFFGDFSPKQWTM